MIDRTFPLRPLDALAGALARWKAPLVIGATAIAIAAAIVVQPLAAIVLVALALVVATGLGARLRLPRLYLMVLGLLLFGYAVAGRGFAYLGWHPVYPGEVVLLFGAAAVVLG